MADNRLTRQQIYDRIRQSSKEEYILQEMIRLGFWSKNENAPSLPEMLIQQETALRKELQQVSAERFRYQNKEAALKEMRLKRMAEARKKREENKQKREPQRLEKAEAWQARKENEIVYLGEEVSGGLQQSVSDDALLVKKGLPVFASEKELALAAGIDLKDLRFLAFSRKVSTVSHYRKFYLPKKSGGKRLIAAPMPRLKKMQYWILENILSKIPVHQAAHGFVPGKSIVSNAVPHIGKELVVNIDMKDFFPSIHLSRVKGIFMKLGYSEKIATILALICTEPATEEVSLDGRKYFVQKGQRVLPQGAPGSPAITNILCYHLDKRLQGVADKYQFSFTRYADDISFSATESSLTAQSLLWRIKKIVQEEGFVLHPGKIKVMRKGSRQEVTGLGVNQQLGINRTKLKQLRALLHRAQTKGWEHIQWGNGNNIHSLAGYINYVKMVDAVKGNKLQQKFNALAAVPGSSGVQPTQVLPDENTKPDEEPKPGTGGNDDWWKVV